MMNRKIPLAFAIIVGLVLGHISYPADPLRNFYIPQEWWLSLPCFILPIFTLSLFSKHYNQWFQFLPANTRAIIALILAGYLSGFFGTLITNYLGGSTSSIFSLSGYFVGLMIWWVGDTPDQGRL
tara:strand:+ start:270 stop:644 length:375 start_codon:yes stop_codon:yes gene_type:complete